jgi:hypothetical protein
MRLFLRLLNHLDYSFLEEVATHFTNGDENTQQSDEEIVQAALDGTADENLTASGSASSSLTTSASRTTASLKAVKTAVKKTEKKAAKRKK